jgi:hypothetical protein
MMMMIIIIIIILFFYPHFLAHALHFHLACSSHILITLVSFLPCVLHILSITFFLSITSLGNINIKIFLFFPSFNRLAVHELFPNLDF